MAKKDEASVEDAAPETGPLFPGHGEEMPPPAPAQAAPPTEAQHAWLRANPRHIRSSHAYHRFVERGTLQPDGTFVPESKHPVMDGNGCIGVGVPLR